MKGLIYDYTYLIHSQNKEDTVDVYIQSKLSELWNYSIDLINTIHKLYVRDDFSDFAYTLSKENPDDILLTHNSNQLRIALIGPGCHFIKIPPVGWGAVEAVVWNYYIELTHLGKYSPLAVYFHCTSELYMSNILFHNNLLLSVGLYL